jgi:serine/threonine-protein kinase
MKWVAAILLSAVSLLAVVLVSQVSLQVDEPPIARPAQVAVVVPAPRKAVAPSPKAPPGPPAAPAEASPIAEPAPAPLAPARPARAAKASTPRPRPAAAQPAAANAPPDGEAPPAKESKKAAVGDTGKLTLDTVPATEVYFGQNKIGDTPLFEVTLPAGHHALQVINDEKGISQSIEVDIRAGQTTKKRVQL